jgi:hypothetical protein
MATASEPEAKRGFMSRRPSPRRRSSRRWGRTALIVIAVLAVIRLLLPLGLKTAINRRLENVPGYTGHVDHVGLSLIRGAYTMRDIQVMKKSGQTSEPFFAARKIDFSLAWRELIRGRLVSDIEIEEGQINFVQGPTEESTQLKADRRWQDVINDLFPIEITRLNVDGGVIRFVNTEREPRVDISIRKLEALAEGLRNRPAEKGEEFPAKVTVEGETVGGGRISVFAQAEPLADKPHFAMKLELRGVSLPALNDFLRAYGHVDVASGKFEAYLEIAANGGRYEGYVKPFFEDLKFKSVDDKSKNIGQRVWESLVAAIATIIKNKSEDQVATRIPFSGEFGQTQVGIWTTIGTLFRNGFVQALNHGLEGTLHPDNVKPADEKDRERLEKSKNQPAKEIEIGGKKPNT